MSHRPSFETGNNAFYSIDLDGNYRFDGDKIRPGQVAPWALDAFEKHAETGHHPYCVICQSDPRLAMELRSNVISAALKSDDLTSNERAQLWDELAEIHTWLQKDDQAIGDYADARTCARFGTQL